MPVIGSSPVTIPMFSNTCQKIIAQMPTATNAPYRSRAVIATPSPPSRITPYKTSRKSARTKPSSSAKTLKMKSVCYSGR